MAIVMLGHLQGRVIGELEDGPRKFGPELVTFPPLQVTEVLVCQSAPTLSASFRGPLLRGDGCRGGKNEALQVTFPKAAQRRPPTDGMWPLCPPSKADCAFGT